MVFDIGRSHRKVGYFSMEIGFNPKIQTYSGGLGILAGDTLKSCADLHVPVVAVSLLLDKGYVKQSLDEHGNQKEEDDRWDYTQLKSVGEKVVVQISGRDVIIQAWTTDITSSDGYSVPIIFLDTNVDGNSDYDRTISQHLYHGDHSFRIAQEIVLGIGGLKMLTDLGYDKIVHYHLNEGHASFLILELLSDSKVEGVDDVKEKYDFEGVKKRMVFTTHTPVAAGHDKFDPALVKDIIGSNVDHELLDHFTSDGKVNMTNIALECSDHVNGVAKKHAEVSRSMFPDYAIRAITNGVHSTTWTSDAMSKVFDKYIPDWKDDPMSLRFAMLIPDEDLWNAHMESKRRFIDHVNGCCHVDFSPEVFTIGFARRATLYKRMDMLFQDKGWLKYISESVGKIQIVFAGKAHPQDEGGKELIRRLFAIKEELKDSVSIAYLENYNMELSKMMIPGVDVWLNTPLRPREASGTSGMKAAHNGVPQFSILDGWWIEGCLENVTGWSIGAMQQENNTEEDAKDMYEKLQHVIVPTYYNDRSKWIHIMRMSIAFNASFFNTHRMVKDYVLNSYFD